MGRKTVIVWAVLASVVGLSDVVQGAAGGSPFLTQTVCGPLAAWVVALICPIDTMQEWIRQHFATPA